MQNVLVCDDDEAILESLRIYLDNAGFNVITAVDGQDALEKVQNNEIHCVVLDIMMPRLDGLKATLKIREKYNFPIILLSAKSEDTDKITGLGFGADDYVTKPFNPLELVARVKSQIRRYVNLGSMVATPTRLVTGGLVLDTDAKSLSVDGKGVWGGSYFPDQMDAERAYVTRCFPWLSDNVLFAASEEDDEIDETFAEFPDLP